MQSTFQVSIQTKSRALTCSSKAKVKLNVSFAYTPSIFKQATKLNLKLKINVALHLFTN